MAADLKNTRKGNLFVIFGEPYIEIQPAEAVHLTEAEAWWNLRWLCTRRSASR